MKDKKIKVIVISILAVLLIMVSSYFYGLTRVSKNSEVVSIKIEEGTGKKEVIKKLREAKLIKSEISSLIYVVTHNVNVMAGSYELNRNYSTYKIFDILSKGKVVDNTIDITFVEGKRFIDYIEIICNKFGFNEEEVITKLSDESYLKTLINNYDFIGEEILNKDLYYPLEGYIFPDTYTFYKDANIESVIEKMLDKMSKVLDNYSASIQEESLSFHELLTKSSIIENEGLTYEDRCMVSQVIDKRISIDMALQMDSTTSYGVRKALADITKLDLLDDNAYNTYSSTFIGLPVGPISSPSEESIKAALNPSNTDYLYFCSNLSTGKSYFTKTNEEHEIAKKRDCNLS